VAERCKTPTNQRLYNDEEIKKQNKIDQKTLDLGNSILADVTKQ